VTGRTLSQFLSLLPQHELALSPIALRTPFLKYDIPFLRAHLEFSTFIEFIDRVKQIKKGHTKQQEPIGTHRCVHGSLMAFFRLVSAVHKKKVFAQGNNLNAEVLSATTF